VQFSIFLSRSFSTAAVMVGWLGVAQLASHQIALNLASISLLYIRNSTAEYKVSNGVEEGPFPREDEQDLQQFWVIMMACSV